MALSNHYGGLNPKTFEALDDLPPELFREIGFAARVWDAIYLREVFEKNKNVRGRTGTINWLIASMQAGDEQDLREFGAKYRARYKSALPHLGAQATILRFFPPIPPRVGRRPVRIPLRSRKAWQATERLMPRVHPEAGRDPTNTELERRFANLDLVDIDKPPAP